MSGLKAAAPHLRGQESRRSFVPVAVLAVCAPATACAYGDYYPQTTFRPVSDFGAALNAVFYNTFAWTMGILLVVSVLIIYAVWRFREQPDAPLPPQIHGNTRLEIAWTMVPAIIVVLITVPTVRTIFDTQRRPPADALTVDVIGHQWWWEFRYPQYDLVTANQLHVPIDRPISLRMHSADVVHSFWIPKIGGKRDVNPQARAREGEERQFNYLLFTVDQPGHYWGQCAEFCGESHAIMRMSVLAVAPADFDDWVAAMRDPAPDAAAPEAAAQEAAAQEAAAQEAAAQEAAAQEGAAQEGTAQEGAAQAPPIPPVGAMPLPTGIGNPYRPPVDPGILQAEGERIFTSRPCVACHAIAGTAAVGQIGPNLTGFGSRPLLGAGAADNTYENLVRWIQDPISLKPGVLMPGAVRAGGGFPPTGLTEAEVRAVAAYLSSLK